MGHCSYDASMLDPLLLHFIQMCVSQNATEFNVNLVHSYHVNSSLCNHVFTKILPALYLILLDRIASNQCTRHQIGTDCALVPNALVCITVKPISPVRNAKQTGILFLADVPNFEAVMLRSEETKSTVTGVDVKVTPTTTAVSGGPVAATTVTSAGQLAPIQQQPSGQPRRVRDELDPAPHHTAADIRVLEILKRIRDSGSVGDDDLDSESVGHLACLNDEFQRKCLSWFAVCVF